MGITHVTVSVSNLRKDQPPYEADFMVDTGAIDCLAPTSVLKAAGIEIEGRDAYELANGDVVEYPFGFARVSFMGSETVAQIIFGPENCEPILGTVALENTGIGVDPVSCTLKRMAAKPLKRLHGGRHPHLHLDQYACPRRCYLIHAEAKFENEIILPSTRGVPTRVELLKLC